MVSVPAAAVSLAEEDTVVAAVAEWMARGSLCVLMEFFNSRKAWGGRACIYIKSCDQVHPGSIFLNLDCIHRRVFS